MDISCPGGTPTIAKRKKNPPVQSTGNSRSAILKYSPGAPLVMLTYCACAVLILHLFRLAQLNHAEFFVKFRLTFLSVCMHLACTLILPKLLKNSIDLIHLPIFRNLTPVKKNFIQVGDNGRNPNTCVYHCW